jgi:hypothetical protein
MASRTFTDAAFKRAVAGSTTIAGVLRLLGYSQQSTGYRMVHREVTRLRLDTTHWKGQRHRAGQPGANRRPLAEILVRESTYRNTGHLRNRLIREGLLENRCVKCKQGPEWNGEPLVLQLDHINGNRRDNRIGNLRILCPNCHTQTQTFGGRQHQREKKCACGIRIKPYSRMCRSCAAKLQGTKIEWPPTTALVEMVKDSSYSAVGRLLNVSGNAVKKRIRTHPDP